MQKTVMKFFLSSLLGLTFAACANHDHLKKTDTWIGNYNFQEEPIKALADYNMTMLWTLSIDKVKDKYQGVLEVNGQQTFIKVLTDISGDSNSIAITFNSLLEGTDEHLTRDDTLFVLSHIANKIETNWSALEPRLSEIHPKKCTCFTSVINRTN